MVDLIGAKMARIGAVLGEDTANIIAGSIQTQLHERLLLEGVVQQDAVAASMITREADTQEVLLPVGSPITEKRKRGRPKVYLDKSPPTAAERSKQSIKALSLAGGKRVMLRLTPDAFEALQVIMAITGSGQETFSINQALVDRKNELLRAST